MGILEEIKSGFFLLDGGMGTLLQLEGLEPGELPERWNVSHSDVVTDIHRQYFDAGTNMVCTNTFGANPLKYGVQELEQIIRAAVENAKHAAELSKTPQNKYVALDIGPLGRLLKPYGDLAFADAVEAFAAVVRIGAACGVEAVFIETMNDSYETKAAVLAAKENCDLPVFASNAYGSDGKLMTGATPDAMVAMLEGLGVDALGANCSLGPQQLSGVVDTLLQYASVPVLVKPNAGLPVLRDGRTLYDLTPADFAAQMAEFAQKGATVLGGCCGTTPEYIRALSDAVKKCDFRPVAGKDISLVSSYTHSLTIGREPIVIGERLNPTGKKRLKEALRGGEMDYVLREGLTQQEAGAHALDVNVGLPELDEKVLLPKVIYELQSVVDLPLQIDTSDADALEKSLRLYNGKALVNSVNGKEESLHTVLPLVKKYGGVVVALTLDENGIPADADGRLAIVRRVLAAAEEYGIAKKDILFDPLCLPVSAEPNSAEVTLQTLRRIRDELGCHTIAGVSNVSFGLPRRELVNASFFTLALENGLNAAIINPGSEEMKKAYRTFCLLRGMDEGCRDYISFAETMVQTAADVVVPEENLQNAIVNGLQERASEMCRLALETMSPLEVISREIVPALDIVGKGFEEKKVYLPQLLMSAEAAKAAFEQVKKEILQGGSTQQTKGKVVLATVRGDIHDIGKNIVRVLLENYGFGVIDLGRDVAPETIVDAVLQEGAFLCGLSALMTTTVPAMEKTVALLKEKAPHCRTVVGGAVLTARYASAMGADYYAADAMETVRYAEQLAGGGDL